MIISYRHNFIFIKTKKTAGTSLEIALSTHCGPEDLVTPLGNVEEIERQKWWPGLFPRNFTTDKNLEANFRDAIGTGDRKTVRDAYNRIRSSASGFVSSRHSGARAARKISGEEFFNKAYKFTIERHPYDKAVSLAWFELSRRGNFDTQLTSVLKSKRYRNYDQYTIDGKPVVDFIMRYENLAEDLAAIEKRLGGLALAERLPRSNSRQRKDRRPAHEILSDAQKAVVRETCREEFELLGYEP